MNKALLIGMIFVATTSFAQTSMKRSSVKTTTTTATTTNTSTASTQSVSASDWKENHLSVGGILSTSSDLTNAELTQNGNKVSSGDLSGSNALGVTAQWQSAWNGPWDWTIAGTVFTERQISSYKGKNGGSFKSKPSYQPWMVSAGAVYRMNDQVYFPVGLNTTLINQTTKGDLQNLSMTPQLGYQFGVGAKLNRNIAAELLYQVVSYNFDGKLDSNTKVGGDVRQEGLALSGRYLF